MAPVLVQGNNADNGFTGSTTRAATFPGACTPGNVLVGMCSIGANTTLSMADPTNGTWNSITTRYWANVGYNIGVFWVANTASTALTVTATFGASASFGTIVIGEFSGVTTVSPVDVFSTGSNNAASTTPSDAAMTTTVAGDLILGVMGSDGAAVSAGAGYALVAAANNGTSTTALEYRVQPAAGSSSSAWSLASSVQSVTVSAALKAAAAAVNKSFPYRRNPGRGLILRGRR